MMQKNGNNFSTTRDFMKLMQLLKNYIQLRFKVCGTYYKWRF